MISKGRLAAVAAVLALPGAPAPAITIPPGAVSWIPAACATGSIDPVVVDQGHYLLATHMTICSPGNVHFRYALVLFRPGQATAAASPDHLAPYAAAGPADRTVDVRLGNPVPEFGLCLLRDLRTRTACARVDVAPDGSATSAPIAADDPLVAKPVVYIDEALPTPPDNYCGTCVAFR
jgi:hypothetical protein